MANPSRIGTKSAPVTVPVEAGQLKFFAKATGETNPIYQEVQSFENAMHPKDIDNTLKVVGQHLGVHIAIAPQ